MKINDTNGTNNESVIHISFSFLLIPGHVRDLPKAGSDYENKANLKKIIVLPELKINVADLGVDVRNNFEPVYVPLEGKAETLKRLKKLSEQCSRILLATGKYVRTLLELLHHYLYSLSISFSVYFLCMGPLTILLYLLISIDGFICSLVLMDLFAYSLNSIFLFYKGGTFLFFTEIL